MAPVLGAFLDFLVEQLDLAGDIPAIAAEGPIGADDAMAGHQAHHRVGTDGLSYRTGRLGSPDPVGDILVGSHHADGNVQQVTPHLDLEGGAIQVEAELMDFLLPVAEQKEGLLVQGHGAVAYPGFGKMSLQGLHGFPLHGGRHQQADPFMG